MSNQIKTCFLDCDLLSRIPNFTLAFLSVGFVIFACLYVGKIFRKVHEIEKNIFIVKNWVDDLEYIMLMQKGPISQLVLDKVVEKESKPLNAELEKLKMERQFLLDRIPLLGILKK